MHFFTFHFMRFMYFSLDTFQLSVWMVFMLSYIVLLFLYLVHILGICGCLCRSSCKMIWTCFSSCFHVWEYSCTFLCIKLHNIRKTRRIRRRVRMDMNKNFYIKTGEEDYSDESMTSAKMSRFSRRRDYKAFHLGDIMLELKLREILDIKLKGIMVLEYLATQAMPLDMTIT
ncbi:hypothetical protein V8G54_006155 [Vigna mungo]|uniref:Uncharacterized protein n=1 Tax=Vigna mungo TaxID=3915 RepID=A0AAQ3P2Q8_VIGMU